MVGCSNSFMAEDVAEIITEEWDLSSVLTGIVASALLIIANFA